MIALFAYTDLHSTKYIFWRKKKPMTLLIVNRPVLCGISLGSVADINFI